MTASLDDHLEHHRRHAFAVAYRMTGSISDAEDAAQEAVLRLHRAAPAPADPQAWVTTVTTRLCLDRLRSAQARREVYVGPWLPEPLLDAPDPSDDLVLAESVSLALLAVLERLSPSERAAFLLHDVFGYGHAELAGILERSEAACRQLVSRARRAVDAGRPRFQPDPGRRAAVAEAFLAAAGGDDLGALIGLLADDVVLQADSGGERPSPRRPVHGSARVAKVLVGIRDRGLATGAEDAWTFEAVDVNGTPGLLLREHGRPDTLLAVEVTADDRVGGVLLYRNPAKLEAALGRRDAAG